MPKSEDMDDDLPPPATGSVGNSAAEKLARLRAGQSANPASPGTTTSMGPGSSPSYGGSSYGSNTGGYGASSMGGGYGMQSPQQNATAQVVAAGGADTLVAADQDWVNKKWRPMMGWIYMGTCTFDFIIAPVLWSVLQAVQGGQVTSQWQPLTLQGAGLYHIAMGAVLGIAAYGRTKEKVEGKA